MTKVSKEVKETKEKTDKVPEFPAVNFVPENPPQRTFNFEFSDVEAEHLIKLIDIAIRGAGLEVAKPGVILVDKILATVKEQQ